jgi:hypothetical protein
MDLAEGDRLVSLATLTEPDETENGGNAGPNGKAGPDEPAS